MYCVTLLWISCNWYEVSYIIQQHEKSETHRICEETWSFIKFRASNFLVAILKIIYMVDLQPYFSFAMLIIQKDIYLGSKLFVVTLVLSFLHTVEPGHTLLTVLHSKGFDEEQSTSNTYSVVFAS